MREESGKQNSWCYDQYEIDPRRFSRVIDNVTAVNDRLTLRRSRSVHGMRTWRAPRLHHARTSQFLPCLATWHTRGTLILRQTFKSSVPAACSFVGTIPSLRGYNIFKATPSFASLKSLNFIWSERRTAFLLGTAAAFHRVQASFASFSSVWLGNLEWNQFKGDRQFTFSIEDKPRCAIYPSFYYFRPYNRC